MGVCIGGDVGLMNLAPRLSVVLTGVLSRLRMPSLISSSSSAGLASRLLLVRFVPPRLLRSSNGSSFHGLRGVLPGVRLRQVSKQSAQLGRPRRSTIGWSPMFLKHPSQQKQRWCQTFPLVSTKPPSLFKMSTGFPQEGQSPLDPPFAVKQGLHRKRVPEPTSSIGRPGRMDVGSGYMVASGGKGAEQRAQMKLERVSLGWSTEP